MGLHVSIYFTAQVCIGSKSDAVGNDTERAMVVMMYSLKTQTNIAHAINKCNSHLHTESHDFCTDSWLTNQKTDYMMSFFPPPPLNVGFLTCGIISSFLTIGCDLQEPHAIKFSLLQVNFQAIFFVRARNELWWFVWAAGKEYPA